MPLLTIPGVQRPPDDGGGGITTPPNLADFASSAALWVSPDGDVFALTGDPFEPGIITLPGVAGIGAAPRAVARRPLSTGGTLPRWSHVDERIITWPVLVSADNDSAAFLDLWRRFVRGFTSTTPPAGVPVLGILRINRPDGTWREVTAFYDDGLGGLDGPGMGLDKNTAVINLVAPDPWWYGAETIAVEFAYTLAREYVGTTGGASGTDTYETVSPSNAQGVSTINIGGDVDALPTWILTGPFASVTVALGGKSFTYNAALLAVEQVVVSVPNLTVTTNAGANAIGNLSWPGSQLFPIPPGQHSIDININGGAAGASVQLSYRPRYESS